MQNQEPARTNRRFLGKAVVSLFTVPLVLTLLFSVTGMNAAPESSCFAGETGAGAEKDKAPASPAKKSNHSITVYVTSWCQACAMAVSYLKQKNIPFTVKDIEKNPEYLKEMVDKFGAYRGVPVLDIDGKTYLGFHPSMIDQLSE